MTKTTLVALVLMLLSACAGRQGTAPDLVPMPPQNATAVPLNGTAEWPPSDDIGLYVFPVEYGKITDGPRSSDPLELKELLSLQAAKSIKENSAVNQLRPAAIRDAARLVTLQTAMQWRYAQLLRDTKQYSGILDTAFNFGPLMMTQGEAVIMPPVLTRSGASMRIEDNITATVAKTSYELLTPAKYISVIPNWRWYLMNDGLPSPEQPHPAVLPKNSDERLIWYAAVREAWELGTDQAEQLYQENVSRMVRDYRGVMLYHLLTAQHLLSNVTTASSDLGIYAKDSKMHIGQRVYRITRPSGFIVPRQ